jgi:prepilin-type N-terminal cleavage/methylation domain-containing protein
MRGSYKPRGFTLLELSIVLFILTVLIGFGTSSVTALRTNLGVSSTRAKQHTIKDALITFISRNERLPCPAREVLAPGAVGYGVESGGGPNDCDATGIDGGAIQRGIVPWVSLGLSDADALDGWHNRFSYFVVVRPEPANPARNPTRNPTGTSPLSGMRGSIRLHTGTPVNPGLPPAGNQVNACNAAGDNGCNIAAVALLVSYGNNGSGAFTANGTRLSPPIPTAVLELENIDTADRSFVQAQYSTSEINPFDDVLMPMTPADLLGPLERDNSIPSARAVTNDQINRFRDSLIARIVNDYDVGPPPRARIPPPSPPPLPAPPLDGWGTALDIVYVTANVCGAAPGGTAFNITSRNVDLDANSNDIVYQQSNDQLKTMILAQGRPCP